MAIRSCLRSTAPLSARTTLPRTLVMIVRGSATMGSLSSSCFSPNATRSSGALGSATSRLTSCASTTTLGRQLGPQRSILHRTLAVAVRCQGSLQSLLEDPHDPYLPAITDVNLPRIAQVAASGPRPASQLANAFARSQGLAKSPPPFASRPAQSEGEAVLQSLYEAGLEKLKQAEVEAAEREEAARAAYDTLSEEEKDAIKREQVISHVFDGLCATNAVLRMQIEDEGVSAEELDAAYRVYTLVHREAKPFLDADRWREMFVDELKEMAIMFEHVKDGRTIECE